MDTFKDMCRVSCKTSKNDGHKFSEASPPRPVPDRDGQTDPSSVARPPYSIAADGQATAEDGRGFSQGWPFPGLRRPSAEPLGRESFDPELMTEGLGAERLRAGRACGLRQIDHPIETSLRLTPLALSRLTI